MTNGPISGIWHGVYRYDLKVGNRRAEVEFTIEMQANAEGGVSGVVRDTGPGSLALPAKVEGSIEGASLLFLKTYDENYTLVGDECMTLAEYLRRDCRLKLIGRVPSLQISYQGNYMPEEEALAGIWERKPIVIWYRSWFLPRSMTLFGETGTWMARRATSAESR